MPVPLDEYPIHQAPLPVTWAATSDRNFYDRCYFNGHDRTAEVFFVTGLCAWLFWSRLVRGTHAGQVLR